MNSNPVALVEAELVPAPNAVTQDLWNMTLSIQSLSASELRDRINQLRQNLVAATVEYRGAKAKGNAQQVAQLLRKRSSLTRQLFEIQRQLLHSFQTSKPPPETLDEQWDPAGDRLPRTAAAGVAD